MRERISPEILVSGLAGASGGAFTKSAGLMSSALRNLGEENGSRELLTLSRQLKEGSITVTAASQTLQGYIQEGKIDPDKYAAAVVSARLQTALEPHTGKHAR
jgi:hypothetical protein